MDRKLLIATGFALAGVVPSSAQQGVLFVAQPGQILKLEDANGDGDYLDFAEMTVYAGNLSPTLGAITGDAEKLYLADSSAGSILLVEDLNGDGDALDFAEVVPYAQLPSAKPPPVPVGLARMLDGDLLVAEQMGGTLYRATDLSADGDALDPGEIYPVADRFTLPTAVAPRPDGLVLVAQQLAGAAVRVLYDRNADRDFLDFAEDLSYAEGVQPGQDLCAPEDRLSFLTRPTDGTILKLQDLNGDDDVLDFSEVLLYAENLASPYAIAHERAGSLFVAARDLDGTLYHVQDLNADGDALDFAEVVIVALGLDQPTGIVYTGGACLKGDLDGSGTVDLADVAPFIEVLLGRLAPSNACLADFNTDGQVNGDDIQLFVDGLL